MRQDPDPAVVTETAACTRMTATKLPWKVRDRKTGIVMLLCPPGGHDGFAEFLHRRERRLLRGPHVRHLRFPCREGPPLISFTLFPFQFPFLAILIHATEPSLRA